MKPLFYTDIEGGPWMRWPPTRAWKEEWLEQRLSEEDYQTGKDWVNMGSYPVHSLAFGAVDRDELRDFPRWDVVNGWTTPLPKEPSDA